jgi:hypothetical protein
LQEITNVNVALGLLEELTKWVVGHALLSIAIAVAGTLAGVVARWLVFTKLLGPKIVFSPHISKLPAEETEVNRSGWRYRVKMRNVRRRKLLNVTLDARLSILGLRPDAPNNWTDVPIPIGAAEGGRIPRLQGRKSRVPAINVDRMTSLPGSYWPDNIRTLHSDHRLTLEDLMSLGRGTRFRVFVSGTDELSGTVQLFESKPYLSKNIEVGRYGRHGSLNIVPLPATVTAQHMSMTISRDDR